MIDSRLLISSSGTKRWKNLKKQPHRENGPAVICVNGNMHWFINGKVDRIDGPARVYSNGIKFWCLKDNCVRRFSYD